MTGRWFSPGPPVFPTNKTECHNITEILLKMTLNTTTLTPTICFAYVAPGAPHRLSFFVGFFVNKILVFLIFEKINLQATTHI